VQYIGTPNAITHIECCTYKHFQNVQWVGTLNAFIGSIGTLYI